MAHPADTPLTKYKPHFAPDLLTGKVALLTGGGSGICFRIAELFMRHGADTVICSRKLARVTEAAKRLSAATGRECMPLALDVRNPAQIKEAVATAVEKFGKIDILVNGAAGNFLCPASSMSYNAFKTVMEIDAHGTFNVTKAVFDASMQQHGGSVLNITATLHYKGDLLQAHAGAAKAAIDGLTRHLANAWGELGIRVNCVAPGPIADTEGYRRLGGFMPEEYIQQWVKQGIPAQRLGTRRDIGDAALFLCSDAASYVTGVVLVVDGGAWFRPPDGGASAAMMGQAKL